MVIQVVGDIDGACIDQTPQSSSDADNANDVAGAPNGTKTKNTMVPKGTASILSFSEDVNVEETEPVVYTTPVVADPDPPVNADEEAADVSPEVEPETDPLP